jgi:hypothetical protein
VPLEQLADAAFGALANGFPENGALRDMATHGVGPPPAAPPPGAPQAVTQNSERTTTDEHV